VRSGGKRGVCPPTATACDSATAIRNAEPAIIAALIEQAAQGSYLHAKFLFDYAGLSSAGSQAEREASLAEVLLERLGLEEEIPSLREEGGEAGTLAEN
jgi:hypothetical protein